MVKNGEICQFPDQIHHKFIHHFSPFFTIFHHFALKFLKKYLIEAKYN